MLAPAGLQHALHAPPALLISPPPAAALPSCPTAVVMFCLTALRFSSARRTLLWQFASLTFAIPTAASYYKTDQPWRFTLLCEPQRSAAAAA